MKAFQKWFNQAVRPYVYHPDDVPVLKEGWVEALKWVKEQSQTGKGLYMIYCDKIDSELSELEDKK